jgi:hypothetical protein
MRRAHRYLRRVRTAALVTLLASVPAGAAFAQPPSATSPVETQTFSEKSETVATGLALAGIVLPSALIYQGYRESMDPRSEDGDGGLMALGIVFALPGPAVGHWYTNHIGTVGLAARAVGVPLFFVGLSHLDHIERCARGELDGFYCEGLSRTKGRAFVAGGLALTVGSWLYDLITARREVRQHNAARTFTVAPTFIPGGGGVAIAGSLP